MNNRYTSRVDKPAFVRPETDAEKKERDAKDEWMNKVTNVILAQAKDSEARRRDCENIVMQIDRTNKPPIEDDATRRWRAWSKHGLDPREVQTDHVRFDVYGNKIL